MSEEETVRMKQRARTYEKPSLRLLPLDPEPMLIGHSKDLHDDGNGGTTGGNGSGNGEEYGGTFDVKQKNLWDDVW